MKKSLMLILFLLIIPNTLAFTNIYDYIRGIDEYYLIVLGKEGKGADSFSASDINTALRRDFAQRTEIPVVLEEEANPTANKILIGHPCDNSLIKIDCVSWPYDEGQAIIKVIDNDLIIAGTTQQDTRMAAKVFINFKKFPLLKEEKEVLVIGNSLDIQNIKLEKIDKEFVCGDNICEIGEKFKCFSDCSKINCFDLCLANNLTNAACRDIPSNPNIAKCESQEIFLGLGYCSSDKGCCCSILQEPKKDEITQIIQEENQTEIQNEVKQINLGIKSFILPIILVILIVGLYIIWEKKKGN